MKTELNFKIRGAFECVVQRLTGNVNVYVGALVISQKYRDINDQEVKIFKVNEKVVVPPCKAFAYINFFTYS